MAAVSQTGNGEVSEPSGSTSSPSFDPEKCSTCFETCTDANLYRCGTCDVSGSEVVSMKKFICDGCIIPHVKQRHEVLDSRGYQPAICKTHRLLSTLFCHNCEELLCFKDLETHCQHKFRPISEKAIEVKKSVFEYLSKFDGMSKPLAVRSNLSNIVLQQRSEMESVVSSDNLVDFLSSKLDSRLRTNPSEWNQLIGDEVEKLGTQDSVSGITESVRIQYSKMRELLTMSDGVSILHFLRYRKDLDSSLKEQKLELDTHAVVEWCETLDQQIEQALVELLKLWKVPSLARSNLINLECTSTGNKLVCSNRELTYSVFNVSISQENVKFSVFDFAQPRNSGSKSNHWSLDCALSSISECRFNPKAVLCLCKWQDFVAFQFSDKSVGVFDLLVHDCERTFELEDMLVFIGFHEDVFSFIHWNSSSLTVECLIGCDNEIAWEIPATSKPTIVTSDSYAVGVVAFSETDNKLTLYNLETNVRIEVFPHHHGLSRIDNIVVEDSTCALFDYVAKLVLISHFSLKSGLYRRWVLKGIYHIDCTHQVTFMSLFGSRVLTCTKNGVFRSTLPNF